MSSQRPEKSTVVDYAGAIVFALVLWELLAWLSPSPPVLLPSPRLVAATLREEFFPIFAHNAALTIARFWAGAVLSLTLGTALALGLAWLGAWGRFVSPIVTFLQSFPREALLPLWIACGVKYGTQLTVVNAAVITTLPVVTLVYSALMGCSADHVRLFRGWRASWTEELWYCRLPLAVPEMIGVMHFAIPLALIGTVLGEQNGGNDGLGLLISQSASTWNLARVFGSLVILGVVGLATTRFAILAASRCLSSYLEGIEE